jgi:hypothetical protein
MLFSTVLASLVARADPMPPTYAWQIAVPEAAGFAVGGVVDRGGMPGFTLGTIGVGVVAGPSVHWAHGRVWPGVASVAGWVLVPSFTGVGGLILDCLAYDLDTGCATDGARIGTLVGAGGMVLFDSLALASIGNDEAVRPSGITHGYGWQIVAVDAAGLALGAAVGAAAMEESGDPFDAVAGVGVGMYTVGFFVPPVVHALHRNWPAAAGDVGARWLVAPCAVLPGIASWCSATGGDERCIERGALAGLAIAGFVVASFDAQVLARDEVEPTTPTASLRPEPLVIPNVSIARDHTTAGFAVLF